MTSTDTVRGASPRQIAFLWELSRERVVPPEALQRLQNDLAKHDLGAAKIPPEKADASIKWLLRQQVRPNVVPSRIQAMPTPREASQQVRDRISRALTPPKPPITRRSGAPAEVGVYVWNSDIYVVKVSTKNPGRRYAVKLVVSPPRITENGEEVDFSYVRAPGIVYVLTEADRMPEADMRDFMIKYRKCIRCGHGLKAAKTIKRSEELGIMVGKTCAKKMGLI